MVRPAKIFGMRIPRLAALIGAGLLVATAIVAAEDHSEPAGRVPKPVIEQARSGKCVASTEYMRRNHMKLLLHERDQEVRYGIRTEKYSLENCVNCHASQPANSVFGTNRNFCQSCHSYAAVKIDCFECHSSKPQTAVNEAFFHPLTAPPAATGSTDAEIRRLAMLMRWPSAPGGHGKYARSEK